MKMALPEKDISIVLPAYNEALRIEKCIRQIEHALTTLSSSYEVIVAEDGSTDGTSCIATRLLKNDPNLILLHSPVRLGKGKAIKNALHSAKGKVIVFTDADLPTNLKYLQHIMHIAKEQCGLAIGSRHLKSSRVRRSFTRTISSLIYNLIARTLFLDGVRDHQCGFKAMSREVARVVRNEVKSNGFFFDTEMILRCKRLGFPVVEVGVEWSETKKRNESGVRLFRDSARIGMELVKFRLNI